MLPSELPSVLPPSLLCWFIHFIFSFFLRLLLKVFHGLPSRSSPLALTHSLTHSYDVFRLHYSRRGVVHYNSPLPSHTPHTHFHFLSNDLPFYFTAVFPSIPPLPSPIHQLIESPAPSFSPPLPPLSLCP